MNIVSQINKYLEAFLVNNLDEQHLIKIQTPILSAIENANMVELISSISEFEPQIAYLETELKTRELELASRESKLNTDDADFEQIAQDRGISRGELLVNLGKEINEIKARRERQYNSISVLKSWIRIIKSEVDKRIAGLSDEEKQTLYTNLTNVIRNNEQQIDLLGHEIAHRELQTDEEIQRKAENSGKTFQQVKYGLELEVMQRNLQISNLEAKNAVINNYKKPLIQSVEVEIHRPR